MATFFQALLQSNHPFLYFALLCVPFYVVLGRLMFGGWLGFAMAAFYAAKPDVQSALDGELTNDRSHTIDLYLYLSLCVMFTISLYMWILKHYGGGG